MKIGYIGFGVVGKSCMRAFEHNAEHFIVDPALNDNTIDGMISDFMPDIVFISVPVPTLDNGSVDTTELVKILQKLSSNRYTGIVVIKSTIPPMQINEIYDSFSYNEPGNLKIVYSPEFIREEHWANDALNPTILLFGGEYEHTLTMIRYYNNHSHIKNVHRVARITDAMTAALVKYTINSYLAMKVVFMNQIYELCQDLSGDFKQPSTWDEFTNILVMDERFGYSHTQVPGKHGFGYAGSCFPKDVKAMIGFDKEGRLSLLRETSEANLKLRLK